MLRNLTQKQKTAVTMLAVGETISKVSVSVGTSRQTIHRWLQLPEFIEGIELAGVEVRANHARRLTALTDKAIAHLEELLDDPAATHTQKLRADEMILAHNRNYWELDDLGRRITALEESRDE